MHTDALQADKARTHIDIAVGFVMRGQSVPELGMALDLTSKSKCFGVLELEQAGVLPWGSPEGTHSDSLS